MDDLTIYNGAIKNQIIFIIKTH